MIHRRGLSLIELLIVLTLVVVAGAAGYRFLFAERPDAGIDSVQELVLNLVSQTRREATLRDRTLHLLIEADPALDAFRTMRVAVLEPPAPVSISSFSAEFDFLVFDESGLLQEPSVVLHDRSWYAIPFDFRGEVTPPVTIRIAKPAVQQARDIHLDGTDVSVVSKP